MNQPKHNQQTMNNVRQNEIVKFKKLITMVLVNRYWFLLFMSISLAAAIIYNRYAIPSYRTSSSVLIVGGEQSSFSGLESQLMEGFGMQAGAENIDNQIIILNSRRLIGIALDELPFDGDIYRKSFLKKASFYPMEPIKLSAGKDGPPINKEFVFQHIEGRQYRLSLKDDDMKVDTLCEYGAEVEIAGGSFIIMVNPEFAEELNMKTKIYFSFYDRKTLIENYRTQLKVINASRDGTILDISLEGTNKTKDVHFLDKLVEVYMRDNLEKKNHEANRIIGFIDNQLVDVSDSLMVTENQLQEYRSRNRIMDVSAQSQQIIEQALNLENDQASLSLQRNYYVYLDDYLTKDKNDEVPIAPTTMGIEDPLLNQSMQELAGLQAEYFSSGGGEKNPMQSQLELRIMNNKQSLRETLQGIMRANSMAISENAKQINSLNERAARLPEKERQLLGFERKFNLNNVLYTYLLQKRAEAQLQKASNKPDNEIIDTADADIEPISPMKMMIYIFAVLLGGVLPFLVLLIKDATRSKISSEEELQHITSLPIVGHIPHSRLSYNAVVLTEPQSILTEAFRRLRTRLEFFTRVIDSSVILVTSSMPGEGKTFSAINLASAYSLAGKKTLIIGFDLRRPTLSSSFNMNEDIGLSSYLIGKVSLKEAIVKTEYANLSLLPSGPIPPNPSELATSEKATKMLSELRKQYDYIIVDSAPIGVVSDNYPIAAVADATLILVRHDHSNKRYLRSTLNEMDAYGIKGMCLLVNDVRVKGNYHSYNYNYKYNYGQDTPGKSPLQRFLKKTAQ